MSELSRSDWPLREEGETEGRAPSVAGETTCLAIRAPTAWRCAVAIEIANFAMLRRHLGTARARALATDVAAQIQRLVPTATVLPAGYQTIELRFVSPDPNGLNVVLATIATAFEQPVALQGEECPIELVLGGARSNSPKNDDVRLIEEAEAALHDARGEHFPVAREVRLDTAAIDKIALARDLVLAIDRDELLLEYQPKVHLRRQEVRSIEALVRWRHPVRGMVYPGDFIPLAEESRIIVAMTLWTLRQAIADQRRLAAAGHELTVFVNISGMLLADAKFVDAACRLVQEGGAQIGFEITETAVIRDPAGAIANLKLFAEIGVTLSIDDYGAGLSSLAYLKQLPARELKIDKLFITKLTSSNRDPLIVRSTIDLAHALDMEVVAEGVETLAALALLSVMGCDMAQGFLISRPIALDALIMFLDGQRYREIVQDMASPFKRMIGAAKHG